MRKIIIVFIAFIFSLFYDKLHFMKLQEIKATILENYPHIEVVGENNTIKLQNVVSSVRFGMGYKWNVILNIQNNKIFKINFECCTYDNSSTAFCKILQPPLKVRNQTDKILQTLGLSLQSQ